MFNRHPHKLDGKLMAYAPQGAMPYAPGEREPGTILRQGDPVVVVSVWDREHYLPGAVLLAYVLNAVDGMSTTHVPITDLKAMA